MNRALLSGISALLFPFAAHAAAPLAGGYLMRGGYQLRSQARVQVDAWGQASAARKIGKPAARYAAKAADSTDLMTFQHAAITELVVIDGSVADKATLYRGLKPNVVAVEIDPSRPGLPQLVDALRNHRNLAAVHVISHASAGELRLGSSRVRADDVHRDLTAQAALRSSVREGGDLLFYGCDLAADADGEALINILQASTGLDVAASSNSTGNAALGGDWNLEVVRGNIEATSAFTDKALRDFSGVLAASDGLKNFTAFSDGGTELTDSDFIATAHNGAGAALNIGRFVGDTSLAYVPSGWSDTGNYFYVRANGTSTTRFELTALTAGEAPGYSASGVVLTHVRVVGIRTDGTTVNSSPINGTAGVDDTFSFSLGSFNGINLKGFKLYFDCGGGCNVPTDEAAYMEFRNFSVLNASAVPLPPAVTDPRISISGATGTGGAYKIGDTVTATWDNTAATGDNNSGISGVTANFSQFGGGAAVAATNSSNTWTATYTITAGAIDAVGSNVSITATNAGGPSTTADSTNVTVDSIAPVVSDGAISISGGTGPAGAYRIGDTVTATWNSTTGGDNNLDTISAVTVNFSQFGGGAAVAATNSSGTWTATYAVVAGAITASNLNVALSATDNAGNIAIVADTSNAAVDSIAPSVTSTAPAGGALSTDASVNFVVNFSESVANISFDDFALTSTGGVTGSIASVSATSGSSVTVTVNGISGNGSLKLNLSAGTNIVDAAGNTAPAYTSGTTHNVAVPTVSSAPTIGTATAGDSQANVTFTAPASNGGSAITIYSATSSPAGGSGSCAGPAACTITVSPLSNGTSYTFTVTATNGVGTSAASGVSNAVTPKANQTITFANPGAQSFGTSPTLSASASSGLTVTFTSSTPGICTITGVGVLTFLATGSCTINAIQTGNTSTNAAPTVPQSFNVSAVVPGAPTMGAATAGNAQASVTFTPPASNGGAGITGYTVTSNPIGGTGSGGSSPITVNGLTNGTAYTFTVTATNSAGTGGASAASNSVTPAAPQTITFNNPGAQDFGTTPTLTATSSAGGGYVVSFTTASAGVCTITAGGALSFVTAGSCTINANQPGDSSYLAASQVSQTFTVNAVVPGAPTAATATAGDTQASVAFTAPVFAGGTPITGYRVTVDPPGVVPVNGAASPIVVTGLTNGVAYTFKVAATNLAGTGLASAASNSITPAASQTITFVAPGPQNFGTMPTLSATSDSGLTPVFTSATPGVCTITGIGALTFVTVGSCTINADQAGNASYLPAPQVTHSFAVNAVLPGAPTIGTASAGNAEASVSFIAPASSGGAAITGYTVTASPGGAAVTGSASPITLTGLTNGTAYTFTVAAINTVGTGSPSAPSNSVVPRLLTVTGTPHGMAGTAMATLSGGGANCTLTPPSGFASLSNPAPTGTTMPYGEYAFRATACTGTVTMAITYPQALPAGTQFWKYGPPTAAVGGVAAASTWFQLGGVTLSADRMTVTYTITDDGVGDSDATPGSISDPFAPAAAPMSIPVDAPWALGLLSAALGFLGWRSQRRLSRV